MKNCSCIHCRREFSHAGIHTHYLLTHDISAPARKNNIEANIKKHTGSLKGAAAYAEKCRIARLQQEAIYYAQPNTCKECGAIIPYDKRLSSKFCNRSCSATFNSKLRSHTPETRLKISLTLSDYNNKKPGLSKKQLQHLLKYPEGPFSKVRLCECAHCNKKWYSQKQRKYCDECSHLYSHNGRAKYWFAFNIFNYPDLFDLSLITTIGFRDSKTNPNGISRDHKISVNMAIRHGYDPYYITHPMNCELMLFEDNNKKHISCSLLIEDLIELVNQYDLDHPPGG